MTERTDRNHLRRLIEAALPPAKERAELIGQMRDALLAGDDMAALRLARKVCGLPVLTSAIESVNADRHI